MDDCLFCRIVAGKIPATVVYEDDDVMAINDVFPRAPFHVLVVPRKHVERLSDLEDEPLGGRLLQAVRKVARQGGVGDNFRLVVNNGDNAGQNVLHLHLHVLGGREFAWPPG
ncbi:MAG: histidine triad nucleotide-binding protein [Chloroflexi bacterium]|nr:MAG: histidine triad nucleotide-binding protein [Chloroflexota bacterium]TMF55428.1 MAG: histidine triad nucleotide-binding protein [Chloroflexota bacterium]HEV8670441.1 histidine triad nucleotide-binding protein [Candidatus Limnocylindria bacterium]